jgi:hypothetical protein
MIRLLKEWRIVMSNLVNKYKDKIYPIEDVKVGMLLRVEGCIKIFKNKIAHKFDRGTIGTVIESAECHKYCSKYKSCYNRVIALKINGTDEVIYSCHYTFLTVDGYRVGYKEMK